MTTNSIPNLMNNQQAYNQWARNYDTVINKTRDLEGKALRTVLSHYHYTSVLEIGCGTGKNTEWLIPRAEKIIAADFSVEMLAKAKFKIDSHSVEFRQTDIREAWNFREGEFDLIICSLVLEHIENIEFVFREAKTKLKAGGLLYIGELHPFKQLMGSKARFETVTGTFELECFIHHYSDYFNAALTNGMKCIGTEEWFDDDDRTTVPRLLTMVFQKNSGIPSSDNT